MKEKIIALFEKAKKSLQSFAQAKYSVQVAKLKETALLSKQESEELLEWLKTHEFYFAPMEFAEYKSNLNKRITATQNETLNV